MAGKKDGNEEGRVKIVGLNHGLCLAHTLFLEGWKRECYADVTFYCRPSPIQRQKNQPQPRKNLRANRSVLAAASPFFARLLPDCELESDVCVTTELTYDDMFCVLEYVYSGKLLCPTDSRNRLQEVLRQFQIVVPDDPVATDIPEIEILVEEADPFPPATSSTRAKGTIKIYRNKNRKTVPSSLDKTQSKTETTPAKPVVPVDHSDYKKGKTYAAKSKTAAVRPPIKLLEVGSIFPRQIMQDSPKIAEREVIDYSSCTKEMVTLPPALTVEDSSDVNPLRIVKDVLRDNSNGVNPDNQSKYPLHLYVLHTWGQGIHSNMERSVGTDKNPVSEKPPARSRGPSLIHNWTSHRQPTFLTSRPSKVYNKGGDRKAQPSNQSVKDKNAAVLRLDDIQNMKHHKGKIHVTLNGEPLLQQSVPQLFHTTAATAISATTAIPATSAISAISATSVTPVTTTTTSETADADDASGRLTPVDHDGIPIGPDWNPQILEPVSALESQQDKADYYQAKRFVQEEVKRKQRILLKIRMFTERLQQ